MKSSLFAKVRRVCLAWVAGLTLLSAAHAGPVLQDATQFRVQFDSRGLSGDGWLAFTLLPGALPASGVQARLSQFSGNWQTGQVREGDVQGDFPLLQLGNTSGYNELLQAVQWGGMLEFELSFGGNYALLPGDIGSTLGIAMLSADQQSYLGNPQGNVLEFALMPGLAGLPATLSLNNHAPDLAQVRPMFAPVPEPDVLALSAIGLLMLLACSRRPCTRVG